MTKTVTAIEAGVHFGELLHEVSEGGATIVVEQGGEPVAVVLPIGEYTEYERLREPHGTNAWTEALELARRSRLRVRKELGGRTLISPEEMIRADREERSGQLTGLP